MTDDPGHDAPGGGAGAGADDVAGLRGQVLELAARVEGLVRRVDEHDEQLPAAGATGSIDTAREDPRHGAGEDGPAGQQCMCGSLYEWVEEVFCWHFVRDHQGTTWFWCPRWWEHVEAVSRLTALWHAWEAMHRTTPGGAGLAGWYHELDHQLPILMGPHGPFRSCKAGVRHEVDADPLPTEVPDEDNPVLRSV